MKHRIAAGVLLEHEGKILLVRHHKPGSYDFWVAPGGGAEGTEDLRATARREALEECGLILEPQAIAYIEEFNSPTQRECKIWFTARLLGGVLSASAAEASREHIVEAAFLARSEFEGKTVFPSMLSGQYWEDKANGFAFRGMWAFARWSSTSVLPHQVYPHAKSSFGCPRVRTFTRTI